MNGRNDDDGAVVTMVDGDGMVVGGRRCRVTMLVS